MAACHPLLFWEASSFDVVSLTNSTTLNFHVSMCLPGQMLSYPVCLHPEFGDNNRHSISVPIKTDVKPTSTIPLVMTSHWQNGMLFLLLKVDPCPLVLLHNRTNMDIYYGQSCLDIDGKCFVFIFNI